MVSKIDIINQMRNGTAMVDKITLKIMNDPDSYTNLLYRLGIMALFFVSSVLSIGTLLYWGNMIFADRADIFAMISKYDFIGFFTKIITNRTYIEFIVWQTCIMSIVFLCIHGMQKIHTSRVRVFKSFIIGAVCTMTFVACGIVCTFGLDAYMKTMSDIQKYSLTGVVCAVTSFISYFIYKGIAEYYIAESENKKDIDDPYFQENAGKREVISLSELMAKEKNNYTIVGKMVKNDKVGKANIKNILPMVFSLWGILITLPISIVVFLLSERNIEWIFALFTMITKYLYPSTLALNVFLIASTIVIAQGYGVFILVLSLFFGSLVGETRLGNDWLTVFTNSFKKTAFESIYIASDVFYGIMKNLFLFFLNLVILTPWKIVIYLIYRDSTILYAPFISIFSSISFLLLNAISCLKKSFMYFRLGMYPASYLKIADRERFFADPRIFTMSWNFNAYILITGILICFLIGYFIYSLNKQQGIEEKSLIEKLKNPSARLTALAIYTLAILLVLLIPGAIMTSSVRHEFIYDVSMEEIARHMVKEPQTYI